VYADFTPAGEGASGTTLSRAVQVAGDYSPVASAPTRTDEVDGYTVTLDGDLAAGSTSELTLSVSRDGAPVTELEPYLGTYGHLAAYAGLAPVTRRSGSSIRGEHPSRAGNKRLKRAFFLAAFAALSDPTSRAYYDRKRAQGKKHNAALVCLARRRIDVLHAMLKHGTIYETRSPAAA
jgi:hypothetical protein